MRTGTYHTKPTLARGLRRDDKKIIVDFAARTASEQDGLGFQLEDAETRH